MAKFSWRTIDGHRALTAPARKTHTLTGNTSDVPERPAYTVPHTPRSLMTKVALSVNTYKYVFLGVGTAIVSGSFLTRPRAGAREGRGVFAMATAVQYGLTAVVNEDKRSLNAL